MIDIARHVRPISGRALRMVEAQHRIATLKLVDSVEEQAVLEGLIDAAKPPLPAVTEDRGFAGLHYLLAAPFRYPPLRHGSRFGRRDQRGVFYGARSSWTVMAEVAYYRLWFLEGSAAALDHVETWHTLFAAGYRAARGLDLTRREFARHRAALTSRDSYVFTQEIGDRMREAGVTAFRAPSARDRDPRGVVIGVLSPAAFISRRPDPGTQTWACLTTRPAVIFRRRDPLAPEEAVFAREEFVAAGDGRLPAPPG